MSCKTILAQAGSSPRTGEIAACASRIAIAQQARLVDLASTGIQPRVCQCNAAAPGAPLLSLAAERGADLLVMGCCGHARFRELLSGGVTRRVPGRMTTPVLMAR